MKRGQLKRYCNVCGEVYYPRRDTGKYCSPKCRCTAYRERHKEPVKASEVAIKRWRTKMQNVRLETCVQCDATFFVNGLSSHRLYCSNSCKQKAYRERKAYKAQKAAIRRPALPQLPVTPVIPFEQAAR